MYSSLRWFFLLVHCTGFRSFWCSILYKYVNRFCQNILTHWSVAQAGSNYVLLTLYWEIRIIPLYSRRSLSKMYHNVRKFPFKTFASIILQKENLCQYYPPKRKSLSVLSFEKRIFASIILKKENLCQYYPSKRKSFPVLSFKKKIIVSFIL